LNPNSLATLFTVQLMRSNFFKEAHPCIDQNGYVNRSS